MGIVAGAGLGRGNYFGRMELGMCGGTTVSTSCQNCCLEARSSLLKISLGTTFHLLKSSSVRQFPRKTSAGWCAARRVNATIATGNGAFTGGNRTEDISEALSRVVPPFQSEKDSAVFRVILAAIASVALAAEKQRRREKTEVPLDALRQGRLVESRLVYRQTFVIRSYEIGADRTASIEAMMNHFQETALNHVWMSGLAGDGFGATQAMSRNNLIWVVTRMQVHVEQYPVWGNVVEMDTWVGASKKNGMRRDWLVRDLKTGQILARATSTWVTMNKETRKLSKMPEEVRAEISPHFHERSAMNDQSEVTQRISKINGSAEYVHSGLMPRRSDLDMNQHVNNVKYIGWMLETVPPAVLDRYELATMTLEYRRECGQSDMVQSLTSLESSTSDQSQGTASSSESNGPSNGECNGASSTGSKGTSNGFPHATAPPTRMHEIKDTDAGDLRFVHLLRMESDGTEIVRGRTRWRPKN